MWGSNSRPWRYQHHALPAELKDQVESTNGVVCDFKTRPAQYKVIFLLVLTKSYVVDTNHWFDKFHV